MTPSRAKRLSLVAAAAALTAACSPLSLFATLAPKDPAIRVTEGAAFGPDPRQMLDVYAPRKAAPGGAPVAVFIYGGSWDSGRRQDYNWVGRALAAKGFVTVVPDYRVYPQVKYPAFLDDGAKAVRWAEDHARSFGGDPDRIVLVGHSAGAYNVAMLALDSRYLKAAGVAPGHVKAFAGLSGPYDFLPLDGPITQKIFGGTPDLPATQPIAYVAKSSPPAFLASGDADTMVYPRNTQHLAAALRAKGVTVEEHIYPGIDHVNMVLALSRTFRGKAPVLDEMTSFLLAHSR